MFEVGFSLVASSPFDLIVRTKLCSFWNFLLEGLKQIYTTWDFSFHSSITLPIGTCMTPNLQQFKVKQNTGTFNSISKLMTSTNTAPLSQHNFLALQFHSHGCTILCACLCWQSYILRGKCSHVWACVGWCGWRFAKVGETHLPIATLFLDFPWLTHVHQPLKT